MSLDQVFHFTNRDESIESLSNTAITQLCYDIGLAFIQKVKLLHPTDSKELDLDNLIINISSKNKFIDLQFKNSFHKNSLLVANTEISINDISNKLGALLLSLCLKCNCTQFSTDSINKKIENLEGPLYEMAHFSHRLLQNNKNPHPKWQTIEDIEQQFINIIHQKNLNTPLESQLISLAEQSLQIINNNRPEFKETDPLIMLIEGSTGLGKTTFINILKDKISEKNQKYLIINIKSEFQDTETPYSLFQQISNKLLDIILLQDISFINKWRHVLENELTSNEKYVLTQVFSNRYDFFINAEISKMRIKHPSLSVDENNKKFRKPDKDADFFISLILKFAKFIDEFNLTSVYILFMIDDFDDFDERSQSLFIKVLGLIKESKHKNYILTIKPNSVFKNKLQSNKVNFTEFLLPLLNKNDLIDTLEYYLLKYHDTIITPIIKNQFQELSQEICSLTSGNPKLVKKTIHYFFEQKIIQFCQIRQILVWDKLEFSKIFSQFIVNNNFKTIQFEDSQKYILQILILFQNKIHKENLKFFCYQDFDFDVNLQYLNFLNIIDIDDSQNIYLNRRLLSQFNFLFLNSPKETSKLKIKLVYTFLTNKNQFNYGPYSYEAIAMVCTVINHSSPLKERKSLAEIKSNFGFKFKSCSVIIDALNLLTAEEWSQYPSELKKLENELQIINSLPTELETKSSHPFVQKNDNIETPEVHLFSMFENEVHFKCVGIQEYIINFLKFIKKHLSFREAKFILELNSNQYILAQINDFHYEERTQLPTPFRLIEIQCPQFLNKSNIEFEKFQPFLNIKTQTLFISPLQINGDYFGSLIFEDLVDNDASVINQIIQVTDKLSLQLKIQILNHSLQIEKKKRIELENNVIHKDSQIEKMVLANENIQKVKNQLIARISHEIKNPLNAIMLLAQFLKDNRISEIERFEKLQTILNSGNQLLNFLNNIIEVSKIESKKMISEKIIFNPKMILEEAIKLYYTQAIDKKIQIELHINQGLDQNFIGDPLKITQIFSNLLSNAIKFTKSGQITINAFFKNKKLTVSVRDSGIGISCDEEYKLFQNYSQLEGEHLNNSMGSGLGLSICRHFCEILKGHIYYKPNKPHGSVFTFEVPIQIADVSSSQTHLNNTLPKNKTHILIVEDNPVNAMLLSALIHKAGFTYKIASDGQQGFNNFKEEQFDLIFMDIHMPDVDGLNCIKKIRDWENLNNTINPVQIIIITGGDIELSKEELQHLGIHFVLKKPYNISDIKKVLGLEVDSKPLPFY